MYNAHPYFSLKNLGKKVLCTAKYLIQTGLIKEKEGNKSAKEERMTDVEMTVSETGRGRWIDR